MVMLFDRFNLSENIFDILFATEQQKLVGKLLIMYIKDNESEITKTEMSFFATQLHEGKYVFHGSIIGIQANKVKLKYNKRQFYDRILTPLRSMGLIDYDMYKKTYKTSENFNKEMTRIGLIWLKELRKPILNLKKK